MDVRTATAADEPTIVEELLHPSYRASASVAPTFNDLDETAVAETDGSRWLDHDDRVLFVAVEDGTLLCHVSGLLTDAPAIFSRGRQCHIDGLYVKPAFRRRGVADALVERIRAWADERGCEYLGVTVHVDNDAARAFYDDRFELTFHGYRDRID